MLDFPSAGLVIGQQFTAAGTTWVWDGAKWTTAGAGGGPFVPQAGFVPAMNDNRIINGDMRIDQRNAGASGTAVNTYTVDRWFYAASQASKGTWGRYTSGASWLGLGWGYYLGFTSSSAYAPIAADTFNCAQKIEADLISDFAWGTANAQPVTLSFFVASSLGGTFSGSLANTDGSRSYPFSFSLTASTITKIIVTIPGDTGGTWTSQGNGIGLFVRFDLGAGSSNRGPAGAWASANYVGVTGSVSIVSTNAATFNLTGVKLEIGSIATPFNRQSLTKSMADCQRYYQTTNSLWLYAYVNGPGQSFGQSWLFPVVMRAAPTTAFVGMTYANASTMTLNGVTVSGFSAYANAVAAGAASFSGGFTASAEL